MLVYYSCTNRCAHKSLEKRLAIELQKSNINLWSTSIQLRMGSRAISKNIDDNLGNTGVAIIIMSQNYLEDRISIDDFYRVCCYDTIKLFLVLKDISIEEIEDFLKKSDKSSLLSKLNDEYIFYANDGINTIATQIGVELFNLKQPDLEKISTGIKELDYLLDGGLIKGSSFNIIGPRGSGKTTIGIQIQKSVLEAGGGCLYITYSLAPIAILRRFTDMGCNITKYIQNGRFRIYDSFSALNGLTSENVRESVGDDWFPAIIRVDDPNDTKSYFENQIKAIKAIGVEGVNVIDAVNERYTLKCHQESTDPETYKQYFSKFKAMAGDVLHNVGIHLVQANSKDDEIVQNLTRIEDGDIVLTQTKDEKSGAITRHLMVDVGGCIGGGDNKKFEFVVNKSGVILLPTDFDES